MSPPRRTAETTAELRASLIAHAQRLVAREGASALTMRALAAEAGCAVGLPYKVFTDRRDLVAELVHAEFVEMQLVVDELVARAGTGTIGGNLAWFADLLLASPAVAVAQEVFTDEQLMKTVTTRIHQTGAGPATFETILTSYLQAEKRAGRIEDDVDAAAFGFLLAGAIHNLIVSGPGYPRPTKRQLRRVLTAVAARLTPMQPPEDDDATTR
ncbi:MAG TPA: TetR/AcrR family transcriptional regulator [Acidimicrobiales bacterium]|jgi:AcrR family transcriptional regulator|nr:TetR/AcrR family transcriptional regulator [Acidimicrobiales bacterium]